MCEYLAETYDTLTLWSLLDQLGQPDADRKAVLAAYTGLNSRQLARKAGKLLLATYDPSSLDRPPTEPSPAPEPTDGATAPPTETSTETPSPTPSPSG